MSKNEIAVVHKGEQGKIKKVWQENGCIFAQFIGRLSNQAYRVKFLELSFLNKKAEKKAQEALQNLSKSQETSAKKSKAKEKIISLHQNIKTKKLFATA